MSSDGEGLTHRLHMVAMAVVLVSGTVVCAARSDRLAGRVFDMGDRVVIPPHTSYFQQPPRPVVHAEILDDAMDVRGTPCAVPDAVFDKGGSFVVVATRPEPDAMSTGYVLDWTADAPPTVAGECPAKALLFLASRQVTTMMGMNRDEGQSGFPVPPMIGRQ